MNEELKNTNNNANSALNSASISNNKNNVGYDAINNLITNQNNLLNEQQQKQAEIINQGTQMEIDQLNRSKAEVDKDATKVNRGLYTEFKKATNPYGANAENLASRGLGNSGYAETTQTRLYNTYQKNVTDTLNNATKLKSDFDFQVEQALKSGNVRIAESALEAYKQKIDLLSQEYDIKNNYEQYLYQQQRDKIADDQWQKEWAEQLKQNELAQKWNQANFDYQKSRDKVADDQWQKEYALTLASKNASGSKSSGRSSYGSSGYITDDDGYISGNSGQLIDDTSSSSSNWLQALKNFAGKASNIVENGTKNAVSSIFSKFK